MLGDLCVINAFSTEVIYDTHLSLVCLKHSLGVHLSHIQNPNCLQHLQQHEQQIHVIKMTIVIITLPHVVTDNEKRSNFFFSSS